MKKRRTSTSLRNQATESVNRFTLELRSARNRSGQFLVKNRPDLESAFSGRLMGFTAHCEGECVKICTVSIPRAAAASTALCMPPAMER